LKILRTAALLSVLALLVAPEIPRYAAERRVGLATAAFRDLVARSEDPQTAKNIVAIGDSALAASGPLRGDPRPWILSGSSYLVTGQPDRALEYYREALATGERAEIDLNLGRAYSLLNRRESAEAAFLRAGWVSPEILGALPAELRGPLIAEVSRLGWELHEGRLTAPPPLPEEERR
jgi:tetratricopeptide (TPR) repeat protein